MRAAGKQQEIVAGDSRLLENFDKASMKPSFAFIEFPHHGERRSAFLEPESAANSFSKRNIMTSYLKIWAAILIYYIPYLYYYESNNKRCYNPIFGYFIWAHHSGIALIIFIILAVVGIRSYYQIFRQLSTSVHVAKQQKELQILILKDIRRFLCLAVVTSTLYFGGYFIGVFVVYFIEIFSTEVSF
ncbi:hypothetical protein DdX_11295 [Ditylenchus destructor]|uniref:Uncharacterized protein n=1 Tax=Ditylenchus destructor TaxID=166010 RepID=A0AAD4R4T6_9BILA|nr:hypothetical protein DdX_11295 [Ditylenchus destructor]